MPPAAPLENYPCPRLRLAILAAGLAALGPASLPAQTVPASAGNSPANAPAVVLSPFEVTADTGDKYGTTQSNSVTMFRTDTDKLPVTADVLTSQFMADLGIHDMDILISSQAAGGGYGSVQSGDDALPKQPGDRVANTEFKLRGIGAGGVRRDGLISSNNSSFNDTFASEGIEILKGPNALLYSGAAGGGTISAVSKQARFGAKFGSASFRIDSFNSKRGELDYGTSVRTGLRHAPELALRLSLMRQHQELYRDGFGNDADGQYAQIAVRLPRSTLRVAFMHSEALFYQGWMPQLQYDSTPAQNSTTLGYNQAYRPPVDILQKHRFLTDANYPVLSVPQLWADGALPKVLGDRTLSWRGLDGGFMSDYNHNPRENYLMAKLETKLTDHLSALVTAAFDRNSVFMQYTRMSNGNFSNTVLLAPGTTTTGTNVGNGLTGMLNPVPLTDFSPAGVAAYQQFVTATTTDWTIQSAPDEYYQQLFRRQAFRAALGAEWTNFNKRLKHQLVTGYEWTALKANYRYSIFVMADDNWNPVYDPAWSTYGANVRNAVKRLGGMLPYMNRWYTTGSQRLEFGRINTLKVGRFTAPNGQNWMLMPINGEDSFPSSPANPHGLKLTTSNGGNSDGDAYARMTDGAWFSALQTDWFNDRVQTLLSARRDTFGMRRWNYLQPVDVTRTDNLWAYSVGANVRVTDQLRPYVSLARSATPPNANANFGPMGEPTPTERSTGLEGGIKFKVLRGRIDGSIAYFDVETLGKNTSASLSGSINPNGLNGAASLNGSTWVGVDQTSKGLEIILSGTIARGWRTAFRASTQDGRVLNSLFYPQYYNDQFNANAAGEVTYRNGTPVYVNPSATTPTAVAPGTAGAVPLTLAMMNDQKNSIYFWDPHPQNGTTQNGNLSNLLRGVGGGSNNATWGTPVNGPIVTGATALPADARQIAWDDPFGNAANGVSAAIAGRYTIGYPRYKFSLTQTYDVQAGRFKGLSLGGQVNVDLQQRNRYITWPTEYTVVTTTVNPNNSRSVTFAPGASPPAALASNQTLRITQTSATSSASVADLQAAAKANGLDLPGRWYFTESGLLWGMPDNVTVNTWLRYSRRVGRNQRYTISTQLNVYNLLNNAPLVRNPASGTNLFGEWRGFVMMNQPRSWAWTNSLSF
jgi:outer membrane receptor protein involved in Fe transport